MPYYICVFDFCRKVPDDCIAIPKCHLWICTLSFCGVSCGYYQYIGFYWLVIFLGSKREGNHEAIIPKELFLKVQEEMARRSADRDCMGRKRRFSANHAFSQIIFCAECGETFKRLHWYNHGRKYVVWRCTSRLHDNTTCSARTVKEEILQEAFLKAVNNMVGNSREYLQILQQNLELAIKQVNPDSVEYLDARMADLQHELIDRTERHENYDDLSR